MISSLSEKFLSFHFPSSVFAQYRPTAIRSLSRRSEFSSVDDGRRHSLIHRRQKALCQRDLALKKVRGRVVYYAKHLAQIVSIINPKMAKLNPQNIRNRLSTYSLVSFMLFDLPCEATALHTVSHLPDPTTISLEHMSRRPFSWSRCSSKLIQPLTPKWLN